MSALEHREEESWHESFVENTRWLAVALPSLISARADAVNRGFDVSDFAEVEAILREEASDAIELLDWRRDIEGPDAVTRYAELDRLARDALRLVGDGECGPGNEEINVNEILKTPPINALVSTGEQPPDRRTWKTEASEGLDFLGPPASINRGATRADRRGSDGVIPRQSPEMKAALRNFNDLIGFTGTPHEIVDVKVTYPEHDWLRTATELLADPDPGETPFLVEGLITDSAVAAVLGTWKVGKTWLVLELALSIVTGRPAFGRLEVREPGPVIVVLEESGEAALHRRLGALVRGRHVDEDQLRYLHLAANRRIRLDEAGWQERLLDATLDTGSRAVFLDPLVRLKGAADENVQKEMAPILDFMRDLRHETGATVVFVHHTGHENKDRMRGSSDLEGYWESKVMLRREAKSGVCTVTAEHREAEAMSGLQYRLDWDEASLSMRLQPLDKDTERDMHEELLQYVVANPDLTADEVRAGVNRSRQDTSARLKALEGKPTDHGTLSRYEVRREDSSGREQPTEVWRVEPWAAHELGDAAPESSDAAPPDAPSSAPRR